MFVVRFNRLPAADEDADGWLDEEDRFNRLLLVAVVFCDADEYCWCLLEP